MVLPETVGRSMWNPALRRWLPRGLRNESRSPFRLANDGIAADDRAQYTLIGGRLVTFGGQPAALVEFRTPSNRVSMLISSDKLATATGGTVTRSTGLKLHASNMGGLHVATWVK